MVSEWPQMAPRWPMMTSRWSKDRLSGPQDCPKTAQHRPLGPFWVTLWPFWGQFGANLVQFWAILASRCTPETKVSFFRWFSNDFKVTFERSGGHVGSILDPLGAILGPCWAILRPFVSRHRLAKSVANRRRDSTRAFLGLPCAILGPLWVPRRFGIAPRWSQDGQRWPQDGQR